MDRARKARGVICSSFTRIYGLINNELAVENPDMNAVVGNLHLLQKKVDELESWNTQIFELMLDIEDNLDEFERESAAVEEYASKFEKLKCQIDVLRQTREMQNNSAASDNMNASTMSDRRVTMVAGQQNRKIRLPEIEFKKFNGDLKDWLYFWSMFKKIDADKELAEEDKFQYLIQSTLEGSRAREFINSFPPTGENYKKVIKGLKTRFGQEDMLVEVYVRELLVLVLKKALNSNEQISLCSLYDKLESQLRALESLGVTSDKYAAMLYPLVESCLPEELLRAWQRSPILTETTDDEAAPKDRLAKLMKFIKAEVQNEERINLAIAGFDITTTAAKPKKKTAASFSERNTPTAASLANINKDAKSTCCIFCERQHTSADCIKAQKMTMAEKRKHITEKKTCFLCFKVGHISRRCRMVLSCILCHGKHFALMCPKLSINQEAGEEEAEAEKASIKTETLANHSKIQNVFLQTLVVKLENKKKTRYVRAVVDTGSQYSYILKKTATDMGYDTNGEEQFVHTLFGGAQSTEQIHKRYKINVSSLNGKYNCNFDVFDQHVIVGAVSHIRRGPWTEELVKNKINISDTGEVSGTIELLIGADVAGKLMTGGRHVLKCGLVAIETRLGWTLMGKVPGEKTKSTTTMSVISMFTQEAKISELWDLDVLGIRDPIERKSKLEKEQEATEHFLKTLTINSEGRYEICLPWLEERPQLPTNLDIAKKRLQTTTKKLKNENHFPDYAQVLSDWEEKGIIEQVADTRNDEPIHYLPHRHVVKENSTTRIRPVFDASANLRGYPSLNQCLEKGQNLLELIPSVLLRFRVNKIGVIADIEKAFLQISICKEDRNFLRFLWWYDDNQTHLKTYRHTRVVFGLSCSPWLLASVINYHLQKALEETDSDSNETFYSRETVLKLMNGFYVDNCVVSVSDKQELDNFICESRNIMAGARMNLRGWEHSAIGDVSEDSEISMVLGLKWNRKTDTLEINLDNLNSDFNCVTKRVILSVTNKLFDPIGFLCPLTLGPKLFLQQAWSAQIGWDTEVSEDIKSQFLKWFEDLKLLEAIKIPRWLVGAPSSPESWSIHTFCDASKIAYAAAVFLRAETVNGVEVQLIQAKSRVALMKELTIPRLELLAATVGARLTTEVMKSIKEESISCTMWSDSTTVLTWIQQEEQWATFVMNRVKEIRSLTDPRSWRHVAGKHNVADLPSRGCTAKQLIESKWWEGPPWLSCTPTEWPTSKFTYDEVEVEREKKRTASTTTTMIANNMDEDEWLYYRFSNYNKILQLVAWILRFVNNCRKPKLEREIGEITVNEIKHAETRVMKTIQKSMRENERFSSLSTYEDIDGVIRLKTRIVNRVDSDNFRRPIVLSSQHPVVKLLILNKHEKMGHAGTHLLLNAFRENFWILRGRKSLRGILKTCVRCRRHESNHFEVEPGPLPLDRVRNAMVFEITGIDFAGPLFLKDKKKCWICLFTCAIYRAVHLELVMSLSTEAFILALRRFIARRGRPKTIFSDNGKNFVGTRNLLAKIDWGRIGKYATVERIEWRFNPPTAAWWGGWWERLIRLLKNLLKRILGKNCLWYEEMASLLCECEDIMNSRPITYLAEGDADFLPLTPSMFMHEIEETGVPDLDAVDTASLNRRVRYRQKLRKDLKQRFRIEYLGQLIQRVRGCGKIRKVGKGEIVLIGSDNLKRIDWPLGRISEIISGVDGIGRVVRLRTAKGELVRPIQKIYPLEIAPNEEEILKKNKNEEITIEKTPVLTRSGREVKIPKRFMN